MNTSTNKSELVQQLIEMAELVGNLKTVLEYMEKKSNKQNTSDIVENTIRGSLKIAEVRVDELKKQLLQL